MFDPEEVIKSGLVAVKLTYDRLDYGRAAFLKG
jgi:hypothetical protein